MLSNRKLRVFLCHASQDKPVVRGLCQRLEDEGWIDPWLDEKKLRPGEDWRIAIEEAVESADLVVICLSNNSVNKDGVVQKEIRYAREISLEKPEGIIFLIPLRLDACEVPRGLRLYQWADYFGNEKENAYDDLLDSFRIRRQQVIRSEEEKARREAEQRAQREAMEKARADAERKSAEREAARLQAEREAAEKVALERARREAAEKEARDLAAREAHRQNQLAAMYAQAVKLLSAKKYQKALDKLQEIRGVDPNFQDRLKIASTASTKLAEIPSSKQRITKMSVAGIGIVAISIILLFFVMGFYLLARLGPSIPFGQRVYLATLTPERSVLGAFSLGVGVYPFSEGPIVRGTPLEVNGIQYQYGLFAHAPSEIEYSLTRIFALFSASIYLDGYPQCGPGLANFVVLLDGQEVYRSPELAYGDPQTPIAISVPIHEKTTLTLKTESLGNSYCDWTVWGDPYLVPSIIP